MNGQGAGAETIPFSVAVKAQGNIEDWLCDLLFKMQASPSGLRFSGFILLLASTGVAKKLPLVSLSPYTIPYLWQCYD